MQYDSLLSAAGKQVKDNDYYKFSSSLFSPPEAREKLFAIYSFDIEISQIYFKVNDPMIRAVRFKWWEESLEQAFHQDYTRSPLLEPLVMSGAKLVDLKDIINFYSEVSEISYPKDFKAIDQFFAKHINCYDIAAQILSPKLKSKDAHQIFKICFLTDLLAHLPSILHSDYIKPITLEFIDKYDYKTDIMKNEVNLKHLKAIINEIVDYIEAELNNLSKKTHPHNLAAIFLNLVWVKQFLKLTKKYNFHPLNPPKVNKFYYLVKLYLANY